MPAAELIARTKQARETHVGGMEIIMMSLNFTKMHGCGNDYVYVNGFEYDIENPNELAVTVSDRHFGIGADGLIIVCPSSVADAKMRMFNADGSEGKMCGNGIRCVARFVHDNKISLNNPLKIETLSGIKTIDLHFDGEDCSASVDMGIPVYEPALIPVIDNGDKPIINKKVFVGGEERTITCVSMGNPHCVIFVPDDFDIWNFDIEAVGKKIENDKIFPEKVNTEFIKKIDDTHLEMRVWERGSGETFACGTGACASVAAACKCGLCEMDTDVTVTLRGGDLKICYGQNGITMTGGAVTVFSGSINI